MGRADQFPVHPPVKRIKTGNAIEGDVGQFCIFLNVVFSVKDLSNTTFLVYYKKNKKIAVNTAKIFCRSSLLFDFSFSVKRCLLYDKQ